MKKLFLLLISIVFVATLDAQKTIEDHSSIELIEYYKQFNPWDTLSRYFIDHELTVEIDGWLYAVSYEPLDYNTLNGEIKLREIEDYPVDEFRKAYLYKRKMNSKSKWEIADDQFLFKHHHSYTTAVSFDNLQTSARGTSDIEVVTIDGKKHIVAFIGIKTRYGGNRKTITEMFIFSPRWLKNDGSVAFSHTNHQFPKFRKLIKVEDNIFYLFNGEKILVAIGKDNYMGFIGFDVKGNITRNYFGNGMVEKYINYFK